MKKSRILLIALISCFIFIVLLAISSPSYPDSNIAITREKLFIGFEAALGAITTDDNIYEGLILEEDLFLMQMTLPGAMLAERFGLDPTCVDIQAVENPRLSLSSNGRVLLIEQDTTINAYFLCIYNKANTNCPEQCYVSFGKIPELKIS